MLLNNKSREGTQGATLFGCHKDRKRPPQDIEPCIGWLLDQRDRDLPNVSLRVALSNDPAYREQYERIEDTEDRYDSIEELVVANLRRDMEINPERYPNRFRKILDRLERMGQREKDNT